MGGASPRITPELLVQAYAQGVFPMAEGRGADDIFWVDPRQRGVLPLDAFRISRSLRRRIRAQPFTVSFDRDFAGVVAGCADRDETWINDTIAGLYRDLHAAGVAHSIEVWDGDILAGGVYGVVLGAAFFGESMFSRRRDASKIALAYLVDRLRQDGFQLFDTQFLTNHLATLGAVEIPRATYRARLAEALVQRARFTPQAPVPTPDQLLQRMTQTS
ncbi:leucyl/phenylalanyl-tRNA--protein transferase [Maribius pontilimi]|uniref:Leucyl/phenylalanyl-tRNA--protein transferase n=1 Tax=Palleronia pontilimi TaxID=1964209 RepID=A0A934IG57_9RHOB|nr:leucyl/phenylalanyl-tRNA--protein transferase [Palleronia pontilimi]